MEIGEYHDRNGLTRRLSLSLFVCDLLRRRSVELRIEGYVKGSLLFRDRRWQSGVVNVVVYRVLGVLYTVP